jgi:hypothetical protein
MSLLDDWLAKLRGKATEEAGKAAAGAAKKAVSGFAEDFLSFAEGELADARSARGLEEGEAPVGVVPGQASEGADAAQTMEPPPKPSARELREAREAKAREELARLKEMMGKGDDAN